MRRLSRVAGYHLVALALLILFLGYAVVIAPLIAFAHPGRLDKAGCHHVHTRYVDHDGREYAVGTYHCHRPLDALKLYGRDVLQDEAPPAPAQHRHGNEPATMRPRR